MEENDDLNEENNDLTEVSKLNVSGRGGVVADTENNEISKINFIKEGEYYIPSDISDNKFRHFGRRKDGKLLLLPVEFKYLTQNLTNFFELEEKAYFELKNANLNILESEDKNLRVYNKTKHFNRINASSIALLKYKNKDDRVDFETAPCLLGIKGEETVCFLLTKSLDDLSFEISTNLKKSR